MNADHNASVNRAGTAAVRRLIVSIGCLLWHVAASSMAAELPRVPEGFTIARATPDGVLRFPVFATFDDAGRLFVAESTGGDLYEEIRSLKPGYRVTRLEDRDRDGLFEHSQVFADDLAVIMGIAWRDGWIYLTQGPEVIAMRDANGDGRADERKVILRGFGHQTNGGLHGLIFGPDQRLYMTVGQPDSFRFRDEHGKELWGRSGALVRCEADGSKPTVLARGFENLMEVVFLPTGEIIGANNWIQLPKDGLRDALVHLVDDGLYPHLKDEGTPLPRTGFVLPPAAVFPAVSFSGLMRYRGSRFPPEFWGRLFSAQFNSRSVQWHELEPSGASFLAQSGDFLSSDDPDFRPTDVLEAPDGSLLVVHTGSWYVQHCPTGGVQAGQARGGLFRITANKSTARSALPPASVESLWNAGSQALRDILKEPDSDRVILACRVLAARRDTASATALQERLASRNPRIRLAAAQALAVCGTAESAPTILEAVARETDRFVDHALVAAIVRIADKEALEVALASKSPKVRRAAMIALDQAPHESLASSSVMAALGSDDTSLRETATEMLHRHPEWQKEAVAFLAGALKRADHSHAAIEQLASLVRAFAGSENVRHLVGALIRDSNAPENQRALAIHLLASQPAQDFPDEWRQALSQVLAAPPSRLRLRAIEAAAMLQLSELGSAMKTIANDRTSPPKERLTAWQALTGSETTPTPEAVEFLISQLAPAQEDAHRLAAAHILRRLQLQEGALQRLRNVVQDDALLRSVLFPGPDGHEPSPDLAEFEPLLSGGDASRGEALFFGSATCGACHKVQGKGGSLGPDLTGIGRIRAGRDLIEAIIRPSATFAQGWQPVETVLHDGKKQPGTLAREHADFIILRDPAGIERRIERTAIQQINPLKISSMPTGFDKILSGADLADVLAYLQGLR